MTWLIGPPSTFWHMSSSTLLLIAPSWAISSTEKLGSTFRASIAAPSMPTTIAPTNPSIPPTNDRSKSFTLAAILAPHSLDPRSTWSDDLQPPVSGGAPSPRHRLPCLAVAAGRLSLQQQANPLQPQPFFIDQPLDPPDQVQIALAEQPMPPPRPCRVEQTILTLPRPNPPRIHAGQPGHGADGVDREIGCHHALLGLHVESSPHVNTRH